jgi:hypothetical protein
LVICNIKRTEYGFDVCGGKPAYNVVLEDIFRVIPLDKIVLQRRQERNKNSG